MGVNSKIYNTTKKKMLISHLKAKERENPDQETPSNKLWEICIYMISGGPFIQRDHILT